MTAPDRPSHPDDTGTATSTPEDAQDHTGSDHATHGANTNLDPHLQGGPATPADRAATQDIEDRNAAPDGPNLKGS
ncbi:hypothetical protein GCM10008959_18920 [Deinococcus seoulensis]|uniref:M-like protein n=1 Tax=Deinococcus seoulensis TaxID=1837379 RepID=A0ABQ2RTB8_9DEIO|nr:hypothetical protein [Deinococcus seoulensis]GGR57388.1 hypothetical protein GCM10008959_18920 [Deinococcus seoulensis]